MSSIATVLKTIGRYALFLILSIIFLPCFFVVTFLQKTWSDMAGELFSV